MPPQEVRLSFPASALAVRRALRGILVELAPIGLGSDETGVVELVLAEALNNVIEHAYVGSQRGWVELTCCHLPDGLHVTIRDEGKPLPASQLPLAADRVHPAALDPLPEGGFGWFLIRDLARDMQYERIGDSNVLRFRIAVGLTRRLH
ncbi:ATP-binding protein [Pseudooceanicola nanhaiensis]|uniref:ATP-binding protein n=1 Tax=Pseudooceanicola nanhaiensis TaxID=375761 RepID=UPI001CD5A884|nr:ATP-binding protein [Pseudooceanicola nanhaiensis]MCA0921455.1 ATP-binding protein [Pseudooceanicola nanhaiensis]